MVKIDIVRFGALISKVTNLANTEIYSNLVDDIYWLVVDCVIDEAPPLGMPSIKDVNALVEGLCKGEKITAIKAYRSITGYGLKEAKDAIELHWQVPSVEFSKEKLYNALDSKDSLSIAERDTIHWFISNL